MRLLVASILALGCAMPQIRVDGAERRADYVSPHGLRVVNVSRIPVDAAALDAVVEHGLQRWAVAVWMERLFDGPPTPGQPEPSDCNVRWVVRGTWVVLRPPGTIYHDGQPVGGVARPGTPWILEVAHGEGGIAASSLAHELGHVVMQECLGRVGNDELRELHGAYGVPR